MIVFRPNSLFWLTDKGLTAFVIAMKSKILHACELKRYRQVTPSLCAVCPRILKCRSFRVWYHIYSEEYLNFVLDICKRFPEKYTMEVYFMAEKKSFVQIVDIGTGKIDRIVALSDIESLSAEEKLALSRNKNLFVVTHKLEPIVKVEMKKTVIDQPLYFAMESEVGTEPEPIEEISQDQIPAPKGKGRKKS